MRAIIVGHVWKNTKTGGLYRILYLAIHTETEEYMVVYKKDEDMAPQVWVRPLVLWYDKFIWESYENGSKTR